MDLHASGAFDVNLVPQDPDEHADGAVLGRLTLGKRFHGDLDATSRGQMLTGMGAVKGSAGYVAIERVTGTLGGREGSFILQHSGTMRRGEPELSIRVVPDSGTEALEGISGTMSIEVVDGQHRYRLSYALPEPDGA